MNIVKICSLVVKVASLLAGLAAYQNMLPAKWLPIAVICFGAASALKDIVNRIGDLADDGQANNSFDASK